MQNDLLTLKVTSQLHHLSIKCAIHVLHANKFNPNCLRRRPGEEVNVYCDREDCMLVFSYVFCNVIYDYFSMLTLTAELMCHITDIQHFGIFITMSITCYISCITLVAHRMAT